MNPIHLPGFARIGPRRELTTLLDSYRNRQIDAGELLSGCRNLRQRNWLQQKASGVNLLPVGDFSLSDHVLDTMLLVGATPTRFGPAGETPDLEQYFDLAHALETRQWFDTHYHYRQPEWSAEQTFGAHPEPLLEHCAEVRALGATPKPVLTGPLTLLWLGRDTDPAVDRLSLLPGLLKAYGDLLGSLARNGIEWIQLDEPILALDLPDAWISAFSSAWRQLQAAAPLKLLLAACFGTIEAHRDLLNRLPIDGLHLDLADDPAQLDRWLESWPQGRILSAGLINGRSVWRADLSALLSRLEPAHALLGDTLWLAPSCSLLHCPVDLAQEIGLDLELKTRLAFSVQKLNELKILQRGLAKGCQAIRHELDGSDFMQRKRGNGTQSEPMALAPSATDSSERSEEAVSTINSWVQRTGSECFAPPLRFSRNG